MPSDMHTYDFISFTVQALSHYPILVIGRYKSLKDQYLLLSKHFGGVYVRALCQWGWVRDCWVGQNVLWLRKDMRLIWFLLVNLEFLNMFLREKEFLQNCINLIIYVFILFIWLFLLAVCFNIVNCFSTFCSRTPPCLIPVLIFMKTTLISNLTWCGIYLAWFAMSLFHIIHSVCFGLLVQLKQKQLDFISNKFLGLPQ